MELTELFNLIQKTLSQQGFKLTPLIRNSADCSRFVLDSELEHKKVSAVADYEAFYGMCVEVRKCVHRNGAKADTSYYLAIEDVDRSSFKDYKKIKLQRYQTEPTLIKKITKLTLEYKSIINERKINDFFDSLMLN